MLSAISIYTIGTVNERGECGVNMVIKMVLYFYFSMAAIIDWKMFGLAGRNQFLI